MTPMAMKRKTADSTENPPTKRAKVGGSNAPEAAPVPAIADETLDLARNANLHNLQANPPNANDVPSQPSKKTERRKINKLVPPRPFPTVPTCVSATGPRSAHTEGKNYICITRRTSLAAYLRRCKEAVVQDGYKSLHLSAMGAAIPHVLTLATSIPAVLQFSPDQIHTEILTGTVEVLDEILPEDDDQDVSYETRGKSTVSVTIKIGDGMDDERPRKQSKRSQNVKGNKQKKQKQSNQVQVVMSEPEQEDQMDTV